MLVVVLEGCGYLSPYLYELWLHLVICAAEIGSVYPVLMVEVEYDVHIVIDSVVNYLLDSCHPGGINIVAAVKVLEPCGRHTDCIESLCLDCIDHGFCGLRVAPAGLSIEPACGIAVGIERIAEVPADLHFLCDRESALVSR